MLKYFFYLFILFFVSITAVAQEVDKTVSITVSGSGKTQEDAKQAALRSAIEQAYGAFISSKTEMLNDQVVADQMASVSSGNIRSFTILNESQLPDGNWANTIKAIVSVSKLTSFVESKGIAIEIKGGLFALNIKQQILNEQGEVNAISDMVGLLHEPMQLAFDYSIKSGEPKSIDPDSKNWVIPLEVTAKANKNMEFCARYCIKTLAAISLSTDEVSNYKSLNKEVFPVIIQFEGIDKIFYLRKVQSIFALASILNQWKFYTSLFDIKTDIWRSYNFDGSYIDLSNNDKSWYDSSFNLEAKFYHDGYKEFKKIIIKFLNTGSPVAIFSLSENISLSKIEQIDRILIRPQGIVSKIINGGYFVSKELGYGLVVSNLDIGVMTKEDSKNACWNLVLNGFGDWRLPSVEELKVIHENLGKRNIGGFINKEYWSSNGQYAFRISTYFDRKEIRSENNKHFVRAVRTF